MSVIRVVQLACDGPDCYTAWLAASSDVYYASAQRAAAKAAGWAVAQPGGRDFCPKCRATPDTGSTT